MSKLIGTTRNDHLDYLTCNYLNCKTLEIKDPSTVETSKIFIVSHGNNPITETSYIGNDRSEVYDPLNPTEPITTAFIAPFSGKSVKTYVSCSVAPGVNEFYDLVFLPKNITDDLLFSPDYVRIEGTNTSGFSSSSFVSVIKNNLYTVVILYSNNAAITNNNFTFTIVFE